ncbi:MAG: hypothetical protein GXO02_00755 [Epsilonproteobacteria bacterium]|nr:hypothetical protein [Campylobacterota bacterium]
MRREISLIIGINALFLIGCQSAQEKAYQEYIAQQQAEVARLDRAREEAKGKKWAQYTASQEQKVKEKKSYKKRSKRTYKEKPYKLKPEPFSLKRNEKDPELLGPQKIIKSDDQNQTKMKKSQSLASSSTSKVMDKSKCISLIGKDRFQEYEKKFGEAMAIKRCTIIVKTRGG